MPSITIEVPEEVANRLAHAGITPEEVRRFALHRLGLLAEEKQAQIDRDAEIEEYGMTLDEMFSLNLSQSEINPASKAEAHAALKALIVSMVSRPKMWADNGRFSSAADFISGYAWGFQELGKTSPSGAIGDFRDWLADKYWQSHGFARNLGWSAYIEHFGADDTERFRLLQSLYDEFLQSQNAQSSSES